MSVRLRLAPLRLSFESFASAGHGRASVAVNHPLSEHCRFDSCPTQLQEGVGGQRSDETASPSTSSPRLRFRKPSRPVPAHDSFLVSSFFSRRRRTSVQGSLISFHGRVRLPGLLLPLASASAQCCPTSNDAAAARAHHSRVRNPAKRPGREPGDSVGSTPTSTTRRPNPSPSGRRCPKGG